MSTIATVLGLVGDIVDAVKVISEQGGDAVAELTAARDKLRTRVAEAAAKSPVQVDVDAKLEALRAKETSLEGKAVDGRFEPEDL